MATGLAYLRVVAIDGVALEDAAPLPAPRKVESLTVVRQQREVRQLKNELRRLRVAAPRGWSRGR